MFLAVFLAAILAVPEVNGGLVGGASLKSADFLAILRAASGGWTRAVAIVD